jgi:plastocyanin
VGASCLRPARRVRPLADVAEYPPCPRCCPPRAPPRCSPRPSSPPPSRAPRGASGTIEGTAEISRALSTRRPRFRIYAEPGTGSRPAADETDERRNIVVYLERVDGASTAAPERHALMPQRGERFVPHVLPVVRGTAVDFPNDDQIFHNVFSLSSARDFDLGRYPRGSSRTVTFTKPGAIQVFCHIHSDMSAVVLVLDNGFFVQPDADGRFTLRDVPPGDYTIVGWHERIRPVRHPIHVVAGQVAPVDFNIPLPSPDERGAR